MQTAGYFLEDKAGTPAVAMAADIWRIGGCVILCNYWTESYEDLRKKDLFEMHRNKICKLMYILYFQNFIKNVLNYFGGLKFVNIGVRINC